MSQQTVTLVIHKLLTDEDLRARFAAEPLDTLADLQLEGAQLTLDEARAFVQADVRTWFWKSCSFPSVAV